MKTQGLKSGWIVIVALLLVYAGVAWVLEDCSDKHASIDFAHSADARIHCVAYSFPLVMAVDATKASNGKEFSQAFLAHRYLSLGSLNSALDPFPLNLLDSNIFELSLPKRTSRHLVLSVLII